jgi:hypothetical protein
MKLGSLFSAAVGLSLLVFSAVSTCAQTTLTFDDVSETGSGSFFSSYGGLSWSNFVCNNAVLETGLVAHLPGSQGTSLTNGLTGGFYGMVSASNAASNAEGDPAEIDSPGTNFNFYSVYLTGEINSNLSIRVEGFRDANLVYDETKVVAATYATLFTFDYLDINRLAFECSGGQPAFGPYPYENAILDNLEFESVPEPSSLPLTALAAVPLIAFLRRNRR